MQDHGLRVSGNTFDQTPPSSAAGGIDWTDGTGAIGTLTTSGEHSFTIVDDNIELGGHSVEFDDDFTEFECTTCGTEFEVPEIFQASTGFRQVVYQLYILGHYRSNECPGPEQKDLEDIMDDLDDGTQPWPPQTTPPADPNKIYWQNDALWQVQTDNGNVITDGAVIMDSTDPNYYAGDMLTEKEFMQLQSDGSFQPMR